MTDTAQEPKPMAHLEAIACAGERVLYTIGATTHHEANSAVDLAAEAMSMASVKLIQKWPMPTTNDTLMRVGNYWVGVLIVTCLTAEIAAAYKDAIVACLAELRGKSEAQGG